MKLTKEQIIDVIMEGVDDPGILKCVFMAGGPGSGKSFTAKEIFGVGKEYTNSFSATGLKIVNSDTAFEKGLKDNGIDPKDLGRIEKEEPELWDKITKNPGGIRAKAKALTQKQQSFYEQGRLGMIIDGTGDDFGKIKKKVQHAKSLGYDCYMVFVNTSLEVALERNRNRDRTLSDELVTGIWKDVQQNLGKFQGLFGGNMVIVDNTVYKPIDSQVQKGVNRFISRPVYNPIGKEWIKTARALKKAKLIKAGKEMNNKPTIEERINLFVEENVPTDPTKWAYAKSQAKKKFDVYPSAYANGWAAKKYKELGGGWRKSEGAHSFAAMSATRAALKKRKKESVDEGIIQDREKELQRLPKGAKVSGGGYGPFVKTHSNTFKNPKTGKLYHSAALASFIGGFKDFKMNESYSGNVSDFKTDIVLALNNSGISPKAVKKISKKGNGFEVRMSSYMKSKGVWEKLGKEMGAKLVDFQPGSVNIGLYESTDYKYLTQAILDAKPKHNVYYNSGHNVVNIGGTGYDSGELVKQFNQKPGSSSTIKNNFYHANKDPQKTKREVEKLSNGKIKVNVQKGYGGEPMVVYTVKESVNEAGLKGTEKIPSTKKLSQLSDNEKLTIVQSGGNIISFHIPDWAKGRYNKWQVISAGKIKKKKDLDGEIIYFLPGKGPQKASPTYKSVKDLLNGVDWETMEMRRESVNESSDDKQKVVDYLVKKGNNKNDAQKMVDKNYDYVSKRYKGASVSKKAEIISGLQEGLFSDIMRGVKKGTPPYSIVVIENNKVVKQVQVKEDRAIPAHFTTLKKEYPNSRIRVESSTGQILFEK